MILRPSIFLTTPLKGELSETGLFRKIPAEFYFMAPTDFYFLASADTAIVSRADSTEVFTESSTSNSGTPQSLIPEEQAEISSKMQQHINVFNEFNIVVFFILYPFF